MGVLIRITKNADRKPGDDDCKGDISLRNAFNGASTLKPGTFHFIGSAIGVLLIGVINSGLFVMGVPIFRHLFQQGGVVNPALPTMAWRV